MRDLNGRDLNGRDLNGRDLNGRDLNGFRGRLVLWFSGSFNLSYSELNSVVYPS